MDSCDKCGGTLRAGEAGVCKSCRQTQQEKANVQALADTRAAELAPPPAPKKVVKPVVKEPPKGRFSRK